MRNLNMTNGRKAGLLIAGALVLAAVAGLSLMGHEDAKVRGTPVDEGGSEVIVYENQADDGGRVVDAEAGGSPSFVLRDELGEKWLAMSREEKTEAMSKDFGEVEWVGDTDCFFDSEDNFYFVSYGRPHLEYDSAMVEEIGKEVIIDDALGR